MLVEPVGSYFLTSSYIIEIETVRMLTVTYIFCILFSTKSDNFVSSWSSWSSWSCLSFRIFFFYLQIKKKMFDKYVSTCTYYKNTYCRFFFYTFVIRKNEYNKYLVINQSLYIYTQFLLNIVFWLNFLSHIRSSCMWKFYTLLLFISSGFYCTFYF